MDPTSAPEALFYADDGNLLSTNAQALQETLDIFVELFGSVGLHINPSKTKHMVSFPRDTYHRISNTAYRRRFLGGHDTLYRERQRRRVECPICSRTMQERWLPDHMRIQHRRQVDPVNRTELLAIAARDPVTYRIDMLQDVPTQCPVPGCLGGGSTWHTMRRHFSFLHWKDTVIIEAEGPLPRCALCDVFVPRGARSHETTQDCIKGRKRKRKRELELAYIQARDHQFRVAETLIEQVPVFRYLGRPIAADDCDWPAVR